MCEHCVKVNEVLTELTGAKVASVIMRRVGARLHPLNALEIVVAPLVEA